MPIAVDREHVVNYVLETDRGLPKTEQTIFLLKPLNPAEAAHMQDVMAEDTHYGLNTLEAVKLGLTGWKGFKDASGKAIVFKTVDVGFNEENMASLLQEWLMELGSEIMKLTFPTLFADDSEEGN